MKCGAKKTSGETCNAWAMPNGKCRVHGGKTPGGMASPQFKTGRYSKYLPARLVGKYEQSQSDPDLLALKEEVSIVDARIAELLERIDTGEAGHWWKELQRTYNEFIDAKNKADTAKMGLCLIELGSIIKHGSTDYAIWDEISATIDQRRRLVESERKRLVEMQQVITAERAMLLISALVSIVRSHVNDRAALAAIDADVGKLITIDVPAENNGAR